MTELLQAEVRVIAETRQIWVRCFDCHTYFPLLKGQVRWLQQYAEKTADDCLRARVFVTHRDFLSIDIPQMPLAYQLSKYAARTFRDKQAAANELRQVGTIEVAV